MAGKSGVGRLLCGMMIVILGNVFMWQQFAQDLHFFTQQRPSMCVDGRLMGQAMTDSQLGVDDSSRNKGMVTMKCSFPVAVYACHDEDIDAAAWDGQCRTLAKNPSYENGDWPRREAEPGIKCCERNCLGTDQCSAKGWTCSTGACDAYEKSLRVCASMMRVQPYKCFTIENEPSEGIREDASAFPVGFLIGGIALALCALTCSYFTVKSMSEGEENCEHKVFAGFAYFLGVAVCIGIFVAIVAVVRAAMGPADNRGLVESNYKDLAVATGTNATGSNVTLAIANEAPPPEEGMHWAIILLIIFGTFYGLCCLAALLVACCSCCSDRPGSDSNSTETKGVSVKANSLGIVQSSNIQPSSHV